MNNEAEVTAYMAQNFPGVAAIQRRMWARADRFWDAAEGRTASDWVVVVERETLAA